MASACALAMFSGKIILNFAFVALCGALQTHFHGRGRNGKRQLQHRFLRKRGAAVGACSPERADFPRPGEDVTAGDKKGNLSRSD